MEYQIVCAADYHQGSEIFSYESRGRQCVTNSIAFLLQIFCSDIPIQTWNNDTLHVILHLGDYMYKEVQSCLEECHDYLHPTSIPSLLEYGRSCLRYKVSATFSGTMHPSFNGEFPLMSLECAIAKHYNGKDSACFVFIAMGSAIGIFYDGSKFYVFDSHSRDDSGLSSAEGTCVLGVVPKLSDLCNFLRTLCLSVSSCSLGDVQFDLHKVSIVKLKKFRSNMQGYGHILHLPVMCITKSVAKKRLSCETLPNVTCDPKRKKQQVCFPVTNTDGIELTKSHVSYQSTGNSASACFSELGSHLSAGNNTLNTAYNLIENSTHASSTNQCSTIYVIRINSCQDAAGMEHNTSTGQDGVQSNDDINSNLYSPCGNSEQTVLVDVLPTGDMSNQSIDTVNTCDAEGVHLNNVSVNIACNTDASCLSNFNTEHNYAVLASEEQQCEQVAITRLYNSFQSKVKDGPIFVCTSCKQTFFRHSVQYTRPISKYKHNDIARMCFTDTVSANNEEWICKTCSQSIQDGRIPSCSLINGLGFPPIPNELQLTQLEERLVSPRLAFMQVRELPRGGQYNIKGNVVNVPADVNLTVQQLPRMLDDNETIPVKFKRKLSYKHYVSFENIRPNKVLQAAKWLVENSPLFQNEGIKVDESWLNITEGVINGESVTLNSNEEQVEQPCSNDVDHSRRESANQNTSDNWTEDDNFHERPTGNTDTVLQPMDFREFNQILSLAPGENRTPLGLFQDIYSEFLAFPTIYCGQVRSDNSTRSVPLHYSTICKWELRNVDRRVAMCIPNIFFKLKRLQIKQIKDKVTLAVRKCKTVGKKMTASEVLSPDFVDTLVKQDDGFRVLRTLRGSPPYWEQAKKDVFAMIRQLGIPTWFCSFSAAETKWKPLLKCLSKLVDNKDLLDEEIESLTWQEKCRLIKSDPVTCARYFDHRVQTFIANVLKDNSAPIGDIADYFYRVEFQQRGSPHIHMLIWIKNAPIYNGCNGSEVARFVDKYVSCKTDPSMPNLINYQTHRHARTCRKKGKAICRFNFPLPPLPQTMVLEPLADETKKRKGQRDFQNIASVLAQSASNEIPSYNELLHKLGIDHDTYIYAIQSTLHTSKVFLQRTIEETRINSYSRPLLKCWEANMDIQYILDPYACVSYIVSYISKGQRGLSNLLYEACREAKAKDSDIRQQVRRIGNQFLSHVEIGAQEAAYLVLQMPLRKASREVTYIDTNKPEQRTVLLKSFTDLKQMPKNSTNVESDSVIKRYKRRPVAMSKYCYADFVSWFETSYKRSKNVNVQNPQSELPEVEYSCDLVDHALPSDEDVVDDDSYEKEYEFRDGTIMRLRKKQKVLRYHKVSVNVDKEEHYRQQLMLFTAWRNEETDLLHGFETFEESYTEMKNHIDVVRCKYEKISCDIDESLVLNQDVLEECQQDAVLPETEHQEAIDLATEPSASETFRCFDPSPSNGNNLNQAMSEYDIGQDLGIARKRLDNEQLPFGEMQDVDYRAMIGSLNAKQQVFFYNVLHHVKTQNVPLYTFLTGGAGVGKSVVLRSLYQALVKYYSKGAGNNPDDIKVLLCAPTGKAAHNIGGNTIHSAFGIPVGRGFAYKPLDMQQLDTMRCKYFHLQMVFIDEISMVGKNMFNFINLRLQEIKGCTKPFGGISLVAFGDLFQLKPVMDSWIFTQSRNGIDCIGTNLWQDHFTVFELDEIMRQKDDLVFAQLLNRLREGNHLIPEDIDLLKTRLLTSSAGDVIPDVDNLPHLFTKRDESSLHNNRVLAKLPCEQKASIDAIDNVSGDVSQILQQKILAKVPDDAAKTMNLEKTLTIGIGLQYELCVNVDVGDGMTNGTPCLIKKVDYRVENSDRCSIIWVQFEESKSGMHWRQKYSHLYNADTSRDWTPILETTRSFSVQHYKAYHVVRRQFPLQMAAGKTIHKAQGSTLHGAVVHFGDKKNDHIHYVGLSRVKNMETLHITEFNEKKISVSNDVKDEMKRMRSDCPMKLYLPRFVDMCTTNTRTICFHNCRSLQKHIGDVKNDIYQVNVSVLALCETRVYNAQAKYNIPGFKLHCSDRLTSTHGMAVYSKDQGLSVTTAIVQGIDLSVVMMDNLNVLFLYCPPKLATVARLAHVMTQLQANGTFQKQTILMGDFNQNVLGDNASVTRYLTENYNFTQLLNTPTTDHGTCIDHIYINFMPTMLHSYGTLESYYSDHKPIYVTLKK